MSIDVQLPSLGESILEGTVSRWLVGQGEMVEVDQPIVEVTTDKVDAEIPSPVAGMIEQILVREGEVVAIGAVLARIDPEAKKAQSSPTLEPARVPSPAAPAPSTAKVPAAVPATPVARRIAEDAEIDLRAVKGTGSAGRVTKDDVVRHQAPPSPAAAPAAAPMTATPAAFAAPTSAPAPAQPAAQKAAPAAAPGKRSPFAYALAPGDRVIPMSPMRKIIADHMVYSKRTSPHVGTVAEVDLSAVVRFRNKNKKAFEQNTGVSLTFLPFVVYATVRALREFPALNASVVDDSIVEKQDIHLGVATETEKGLVVPVIRHADRLSLSGTAIAINDLATRAREKKLSADDLKGGTFTVSNPGRQGNLYGFAIINQPQVGILRMGEIAKRPVVRTLDGEDAIVIRTMMYLSLSYDHRAVDGAPANGFLYRIRELLEAGEFAL
ncbi:MAG: 2-oxo acid dehydrogenase subunit E2 [Deltaproteobacteria bacterium]|nr:2-oxo acid dehydrogenase subunit E2 [Deltaproteobacteria bacterium]